MVVTLRLAFGFFQRR